MDEHIGKVPDAIIAAQLAQKDGGSLDALIGRTSDTLYGANQLQDVSDVEFLRRYPQTRKGILEAQKAVRGYSGTSPSFYLSGLDEELNTTLKNLKKRYDGLGYLTENFLLGTLQEQIQRTAAERDTPNDPLRVRLYRRMNDEHQEIADRALRAMGVFLSHQEDDPHLAGLAFDELYFLSELANTHLLIELMNDNKTTLQSAADLNRLVSELYVEMVGDDHPKRD